jgi:outer membrane receptor protein involved in Fe transport
MRRTATARILGALSLAVAAAIALAPAALAQTDVTRGRIIGIVRGADNGVLPGATVQARNVDTNLTATAITNSEGFYTIVNLPTGLYSMTASLDGFQTVTRPNIRLDLGTVPNVEFILQLSSVSEAVTVNAAVPVLDATKTEVSTTIQAEQLDQLPINGRDFKQVVTLTPSTSIEGQRGYVQISGQRGINTSTYVDGVDYNDGFFGGSVGSAEGRAPLSISLETVKEFTVITNGASVEFGRSGGGFVNVVTKSGTNAIHGSGFIYWQPEDLISDFADGRQPSEQDKIQWGASLGGPIIQDKLFYFAAYDQQDKSETIPISGFVLDPDIFAVYPELASPDTYQQTQDAELFFGRIDFQASAAHRFLVRGNFIRYDGLNGTSNAQTRTDSFNGLEAMNTDSFVGSWSGMFGTSVINDLNLNYIEEDTPRADKGLNLPEIQLGSARYGEVSFLPIVATTERKAIQDTVTYLVENHVFKGGAEYNETSIDQIFKGNWRGTFVFNNEADMLAGRWREYRQFGGLGGLTADQAGTAAFAQKETAFFVQDQWFINPTLTLTAGIRYENLNNPDDPILNPGDANANGSFNLTGEVPDSDNQWSPRLGLSWAVDPKTSARFSAGRYWARTPAILLAQLFTSNGVRGTQYIIAAAQSGGAVVGPPTDPLAPGWGPAFEVEGIERIDFTSVQAPPRPGVFTIDPNFENPRTDRFTIGMEREVFPLVAVAVDYTYAKTEQLQRLRDANRVYDGTTAPNGLPRYSSTRPNAYYGRITESISDAESKYQALTLTINRRFANSFSAFAAVTYAHDEDNDSNERNFSGIQAEDYNNLDNNFWYSDRDQRWRVALNGLWDTPWWGIRFAGSFRYSTGRPFNAFAGADLNNDGEGTTDRPTVDGVHFTRNAFRQPSYYALDLRLGKVFTLGPGGLELAVDCYNCLDSPNRFVTNTTWGTGQVQNATFGLKSGVGIPRFFQLSARYDF